MIVNVVLLRPEHHWECPNCTFTDVTYESQPHTRFHSCRGLRGLTAPMVPAGTRAQVVAVEREDYINKEVIQTDGEGRPVSAIRTDYADGRNDIAVLAPVATLSAEG